MSDTRIVLAFMLFFLPLVMMFFFMYLSHRFDKIMEQPYREGNDGVPSSSVDDCFSDGRVIHNHNETH